MKIAYLMLFHRYPGLLRRAVGTLSSEDSGFFIHIDRKSDFREFSTIRNDKISFCQPRIPVYWAEFSQIEATLHGIRQAPDTQPITITSYFCRAALTH